MTWICLETGRRVRNVPWLKLKVFLWRPLAKRFKWPHKVCQHYKEI